MDYSKISLHSHNVEFKHNSVVHYRSPIIEDTQTSESSCNPFLMAPSSLSVEKSLPNINFRSFVYPTGFFTDFFRFSLRRPQLRKLHFVYLSLRPFLNYFYNQVKVRWVPLSLKGLSNASFPYCFFFYRNGQPEINDTVFPSYHVTKHTFGNISPYLPFLPLPLSFII